MYRRYFVCREARREPGKLRQQGVEIDAPDGRRKRT
jgi:hypothetical protein